MRCKVGDLVMVVKCDVNKNVGRTGTITGAYDSDAPFLKRDWAVKPANSFYAISVDGDYVETSSECGLNDNTLIPINPLPDDEELENKAPTDNKELQNA